MSPGSIHFKQGTITTGQLTNAFKDLTFTIQSVGTTMNNNIHFIDNTWGTGSTNATFKLDRYWDVDLTDDAPVRRLAPPREFNRFINASDLMEEFIRYAGEHGARQGDVLTLPIELFVKWLVINACEADGEEPNVTLELPRRAQPRCSGCQRWMRRSAKLALCSRHCADHLVRRQEIAA